MTSSARLERLRADHGLRALVAADREGIRAAAGDLGTPQNLHSIRKSLVGMLVGRLVDAGALRLEQTVADLGVDDDGLLTDTERSATLRDLLRSASGVYLPLHTSDGPLPLSAEETRPARGAHRPGECMVYNNWDFNVVGNIVERASRRSVFTLFDDWIAGPLGLDDWRVAQHGSYLYRFDGLGGDRRFPAYRFDMSARDLVRVGQLMLAGGVDHGSSLVPPWWVAESTAPQIATDRPGASSSYGYLWWVAGRRGTTLPVGSYSAFGLGGQFLSVVPAAERVMVGLVDTAAPFVELGDAAREGIVAAMLEA